jgi:hypothetical protein
MFLDSFTHLPPSTFLVAGVCAIFTALFVHFLHRPIGGSGRLAHGKTRLQRAHDLLEAKVKSSGFSRAADALRLIDVEVDWSREPKQGDLSASYGNKCRASCFGLDQSGGFLNNGSYGK